MPILKPTTTRRGTEGFSGCRQDGSNNPSREFVYATIATHDHSNKSVNTRSKFTCARSVIILTSRIDSTE
eukprot:12916981-Prorocentrum_lima.AAC.1